MKGRPVKDGDQSRRRPLTYHLPTLNERPSRKGRRLSDRQAQALRNLMALNERPSRKGRRPDHSCSSGTPATTLNERPSRKGRRLSSRIICLITSGPSMKGRPVKDGDSSYPRQWVAQNTALNERPSRKGRRPRGFQPGRGQGLRPSMKGRPVKDGDCCAKGLLWTTIMPLNERPSRKGRRLGLKNSTSEQGKSSVSRARRRFYKTLHFKNHPLLSSRF